jgi:hypothetical protein
MSTGTASEKPISHNSRFIHCIGCPTEEYKNRCFKTALSHLQWFKEQGSRFLESIVTGDETQVHHFTPQTKHAGMQWEVLNFSKIIKNSKCVSLLEKLEHLYSGCKRSHPH